MMAVLKAYVSLTVLIFAALSVNSLHYTSNTSFRITNLWGKRFNETPPTSESLGQGGINHNISKSKHIFSCRNVRISKQVGLPMKQGRIRRAALWDLLDFASKTVHKGPIYVPSVLLPKKVKTKRTCGKWNK